jgi:predicted lactoylglutathione lyase
MISSIFVNLPVKDLEKSKAFFQALGCTINPQFTDETAASVVIGGNIYAMLHTHDKYRQFTSKEMIANAVKTSEVLIALGVDSK